MRCSICLNTLEGDNRIFVQLIPCHHVFHGICVERVFATDDRCPLCRAQNGGFMDMDNIEEDDDDQQPDNVQGVEVQMPPGAAAPPEPNNVPALLTQVLEGLNRNTNAINNLSSLITNFSRTIEATLRAAHPENVPPQENHVEVPPVAEVPPAHVPAPHADRQRFFVCDLCERVFGSAHGLRLHRISGHGGERLTCTYPGCNVTFALQGSLRRHLLDVHNQGNGNRRRTVRNRTLLD